MSLLPCNNIVSNEVNASYTQYHTYTIHFHASYSKSNSRLRKASLLRLKMRLRKFFKMNPSDFQKTNLGHAHLRSTIEWKLVKIAEENAMMMLIVAGPTSVAAVVVHNAAWLRRMTQHLTSSRLNLLQSHLVSTAYYCHFFGLFRFRVIVFKSLGERQVS